MLSSSTKALRELYAYAISAKRYALVNVGDDGAPIIRKASQHGLGHLMEPYGEDAPAAGVPAPITSLKKLRLRRWQYDFWWKIIDSQLNGDDPDIVSLDYHPALKLSALGRYGATSKVMLGWFKAHNEGRPYEDQVRPFGFLTMLFGRNGPWGKHRNEAVENGPGRGRPTKRPEVAPVAPYERSPDAATAKAFDRVTGAPIAQEDLRDYVDMISGYPVSAEDKFLNGGPYERGTTVRRHVRAGRIQGIGKEANRVEADGMRRVQFDPAAMKSSALSQDPHPMQSNIYFDKPAPNRSQRM